MLHCRSLVALDGTRSSKALRNMHDRLPVQGQPHRRTGRVGFRHHERKTTRPAAFEELKRRFRIRGVFRLFESSLDQTTLPGAYPDLLEGKHVPRTLWDRQRLKKPLLSAPYPSGNILPPGRVSAPERSPNGAGNRAEGTGPKGPKPRAKTSQEPRNSFYPPRNSFYPFPEHSSFLRNGTFSERNNP